MVFAVTMADRKQFQCTANSEEYKSILIRRMFRIEDHSCIRVCENSLRLLKGYFMFLAVFICLIIIPNERY